ncbi:MAG: SipW-dependent-type signal peptide-containing protein [Eubacteriales bacterium]
MKKKITLIITLALTVVIMGAIAANTTVAWLTANDKVTNTFTVGDIKITLDEAPVDTTGKKIAGDRVKTNDYKLIPGSAYDKDPTVTVKAQSEECYVFVKIVDELNSSVAVPQGETAAFVTYTVGTDWTAVTPSGVTAYKVYRYNTTIKEAADKQLVVFDGFTVAGWAKNEDLQKVAPVGETKKNIVVTAYAHQSANQSQDQATAAAAAYFAAN